MYWRWSHPHVALPRCAHDRRCPGGADGHFREDLADRRTSANRTSSSSGSASSPAGARITRGRPASRVRRGDAWVHRVVVGNRRIPHIALRVPHGACCRAPRHRSPACVQLVPLVPSLDAADEGAVALAPRDCRLPGVTSRMRRLAWHKCASASSTTLSLYPRPLAVPSVGCEVLGVGLGDAGHDVTYLTTRRWDASDAPILPGVDVVGLEQARESHARGRRSLVPPLLFGLAVMRYLGSRPGRFDVVHTASFPLTSPFSPQPAFDDAAGTRLSSIGTRYGLMSTGIDMPVGS